MDFPGFDPDKEYMVVDPPSGSRYGFPKVFDFKPSGDPITYDAELEEWFLGNGYPQREIDAGMIKYCRYWTQPRVQPAPVAQPSPTNVVEFPKK